MVLADPDALASGGNGKCSGERGLGISPRQAIAAVIAIS
jgi:hypothetical protein